MFNILNMYKIKLLLNNSTINKFEMISFKIISSQQYNHYKNQQLLQVDHNVLINTQKQLIQHLQNYHKMIKQMKINLNNQQIQNSSLIIENIQLTSKITELQSEIQKLNEKVNELNQKIEEYSKKKQSKCDNPNLKYQQKEINQLKILFSKIKKDLIREKQKNTELQININSLQRLTTQLNQNISNLNLQKDLLSQENRQKISQINQKNLQIIKEKQQNTKINEEIIKLHQQITKLQNKYELLIKENDKSKNEPIGKLQDKLKAKDEFINQLTRNISELKQKYLQLQMQRLSSSPYHKILPATKKPINFQQSQRIKYIHLLKSLLFQFKSKLKKIDLQKKSLQQKYRNIKLKINEYQYNEFKYKDKLSIYMQKIEKYEILTERQHNEMERFILEFDEELSNVLKCKEEEIKVKVMGEIIGGNGNFRINDEKKEEGSRTERFDKNQDNRDGDQIMMIMKKEIERIKQQLKQAKKAKKKKNWMIKSLQNESYNNTIELRKYKYLVQQLLKQLQIKINENQLLKNYYPQIVPSNGQQKNCDEYKALDNVSVRHSGLSGRNENQVTGKQSNNSDIYEYQVSQIDCELQSKHNILLNKIIFDRAPLINQLANMERKNTDGSKSGRESSSYSSSNISQMNQSSPNSSHSSFKSYKSNNFDVEKFTSAPGDHNLSQLNIKSKNSQL